MEGTEHLNKEIKKALTHTNNHWGMESPNIPYEGGDDSWIQVLRQFQYCNIIKLHDMPSTRRQRMETH